MYIDSVEFTDIRTDAAKGRARALCTLHSDQGTTQLMVRTDLAEGQDTGAAALRPALFADAIRQMVRMPEFRAGLRQIGLSASLPPEFRQALPGQPDQSQPGQSAA